MTVTYICVLALVLAVYGQSVLILTRVVPSTESDYLESSIPDCGYSGCPRCTWWSHRRFLGRLFRQPRLQWPPLLPPPKEADSS